MIIIAKVSIGTEKSQYTVEQNFDTIKSASLALEKMVEELRQRLTNEADRALRESLD